MPGPNASERLAAAEEHPGGAQPEDFHASSAMVRAEADDLDATLGALVTRLQSVPGLEVKVSPRPGMLRKLIGDLPYIHELGTKSAHVHEVVVTLGQSIYWLHATHGAITCGRANQAGAQGPQDEPMPFRQWATELFDDIAQRNLVNHDAMAALRRLVEQDRL
jgi:hypothetical protein